MATGRMVRRQMVHAKKIATCSDRARFMWVAILVHADKAGRVNADPNYLKGEIFRHLEYSVDQIVETVVELARCALVTLYGTAEEPAVLEIVRFADFNKVDDREPDSAYAGPDEPDSLPWPSHEAYAEFSREPHGDSASEEEGERHSEQEVEEELSSTSREVADAARKPVAQARRASVDHQKYVDVWNQAAENLPKVRKLNDARRRSIEWLVKEHGPDALDLLRDAARQVANDDYWAKRQYGFDTLVPGKVLAKAEAWRSGREGAVKHPLGQYKERGL